MEPCEALSGLAQFAADPGGYRAGRGDRPSSARPAGNGSCADIVASPLGRARRTAEIIAECLSDPRGQPRPIRFDERLREISLGSWDGLDKRDIRRRAPELFAGEDGRWEYYFRSPDGETYDDFAGRLATFLADVGPNPVIAVCHGVVTRVLRGLYAGLKRRGGAAPRGAAGSHLPAGRRHDHRNHGLMGSRTENPLPSDAAARPTIGGRKQPR